MEVVDMEPQVSQKYVINWLNASFIIGIPILAFAAAIWHGFTYGIGWTEAIIFFIWYMFCGLSITVGYHRLFSHRSHEASWPLILFYSLFGAGAFQNSIIEWCSDHRNHHKVTDKVGDPYNAKRGFIWSHVGWIIMEEDVEADFSNVRDLMDNPIIAWQHRHIFLIGFIVGMVFPAAIGYAIGGIGVGIGCFIWGGLLRTVFVHHGTFLINSAAHIWGRQPYTTANTSRDSMILSLFTFGEGFHNYHHAFQADYRNGYKWYHWDPSKWWISSFKLLRFNRNLKRTPKYSIEVAKLDTKYAKESERVLSKNADADLSKFDRLILQYRTSMRDAMHKFATAKKEFKMPDFREKRELLSQQIAEIKADLKSVKKEIQVLFAEMRKVSAPIPA